MQRPLIGIVSRFADQKGFDLIAEAAADLMQENLAIVALGRASRDTKNISRLARKYPGQSGA